MKKNKGFTLVELGVSICLVTVVAFLLFQIVTSVKKLYTGSDLQTTLLTKQAIMVKKIQDDLKQNTPISITYCKNHLSNSCLSFEYNNGISKELIVNPIEKTITYDDYTIDYYAMDENITFGDLTFNTYTDFFTIKIPITSKTFSDNVDYGIQITKQATKIYNLGTLGNLSIPRSDGSISITSDGSDTWMVIYDKENTWIQEYAKKYIRNLKINTCSISNSSFVGNVYEFKTNTARWCQDTNFYTQKVANYQYVAGYNVGAIDKDNYADAINSSLQSTTVYIKMNEYMNRYTFKARE